MIPSILPLLLSTIASAEMVRERATLVVDGVREEWSLVWKGTPVPACPPDDPISTTCPCTGFAFGESGSLDLVRRIPGRPPETLPLDSLFDSEISPAESPGPAVLPLKPMEKDDDPDDSTLPARAMTRMNVRILDFVDVDHDGRATEFLLQVGTMPCGKRVTVAVGISRRNPHLHAFTSRHAPETPLTLWWSQWERLARDAGPFETPEWICGDHGSEEETTLALSAMNGTISVDAKTWSCKPGAAHKLLRHEER